jgi:hypothetical protein
MNDEDTVMIRKIFMILAVGSFAAAIPGMAFANPGNPNWAKERVQGPNPFSVETARALGDPASGWKTDMEDSGKPIGAGAVPSGDSMGNRGCEKTWEMKIRSLTLEN